MAAAFFCLQDRITLDHVRSTESENTRGDIPVACAKHFEKYWGELNPSRSEISEMVSVPSWSKCWASSIFNRIKQLMMLVEYTFLKILHR